LRKTAKTSQDLVIYKITRPFIFIDIIIAQERFLIVKL